MVEHQLEMKNLMALCHPAAEAMADGVRLTELVKAGEWAVRRITELEGQHKGLVMQNAMLRQRPDLPADRVPAAQAYQNQIDMLRKALGDALDLMRHGDFRNGNTDPTGTIDEGEVLAYREIDRLTEIHRTGA